MKLLWSSCLIAGLFLVSCAKINDPLDTSGTTDSSNAIFVASNGTDQKVARAQISELDVSLYPTATGQAESREILNGSRAIHALKRLHLEAPERYPDGGEATTGEMIIYYKYRGEYFSKVLTIRNGDFAEDQDFPQIHYKSDQPLDSSLFDVN